MSQAHNGPVLAGGREHTPWAPRTWRGVVMRSVECRGPYLELPHERLVVYVGFRANQLAEQFRL